MSEITPNSLTGVEQFALIGNCIHKFIAILNNSLAHVYASLKIEWGIWCFTAASFCASIFKSQQLMNVDTTGIRPWSKFKRMQFDGCVCFCVCVFQLQNNRHYSNIRHVIQIWNQKMFKKESFPEIALPLCDKLSLNNLVWKRSMFTSVLKTNRMQFSMIFFNAHSNIFV